MKFIPAYIISLLLLLSISGVVKGQYYNTKKYTIDNSAAEGNILQVQQDANGAMWWVNDEAFTRFNGITYQNIPYGKFAAPYQHVLPYTDEDGHLWLCLSTDKKTDVFEWRNNVWEKITSLVIDMGEYPGYFFGSYQNNSPYITIATRHRVLSWTNNNWEELPLDTEEEIKQITSIGQIAYLRTSSAIYKLIVGKPPYKLELDQDIVLQITDFNLYANPWKQNNEPELWILSNTLIGAISNNTFKVSKLFDNKFYHFTQLRSNGAGKVYLLDTTNAVWQLEGAESNFVPVEGIGLGTNENINQLFTDRENNLWLATEDGLIKTTSQSINFLGKQKGLGSLPIQAVAAWGNKILAAGPKGISVVENSKVIAYYPFEEGLKNPRHRITQLWADSAGNTWLLSSTQGLWYGAEGKLFTKVQGNARLLTFAVLPDYKIIAASEAGLFEASPAGLKLISSFQDRIVPKKIVWHNDEIVVLSDKGLYRLNKGKWKKITDETGGDFSVAAYAFYPVYQNLGIVGTENGIYYLKEFDVMPYDTTSLWSNKPYYGIAVDKNGAVWLASDTGVVVMDRKSDPKLFTYRGLQFKESTACPIITGGSGDIWVAMRTGLMVYQPDYDNQIIKKPVIRINRLESRELSTTALPASLSIELASDDNDVTFYFDANSFIDEDKNKVLYKLEGLMEKWEEIPHITSDAISFKNLPPGKYVLKIQLINAGGIASDVVSSPVIHISKPFYNQWWFYASVIAAFFAISFAIFYLYSQKKFESDLILEVDKRSRELRSSEERFRSLWENTSDALALYTLRGDIILYNDTFLQFLGRTDDVAGRKIFDVLDTGDSGFDKVGFRQQLELQQLKPQFELHTLNNGEETVLEFSNSYIQLPNEKSWVMLSLIRNITQRKQTEDNLIKAKDEAEQASRIKSAFLATMSHEIRTPLNAIIGMSSVMGTTRLNDEQQNYVNAIKTSSDSLLSLVNNILDFSKIEAGMMMIEKGEVSPEEIITETIDILGQLANQKGIYLYSRIHPDTPVKIESDKTRLRQVLINLVGNAIKFTEKGYIEISVRPDEDNKLKLIVTDTGIGIPRNKINDLFKVFTQVDSTTTRKYGGTGLGLAITDKLVSLLGGSIKVASQEGKGSQFSFTVQDFSNGKSTVKRGSLLRKYHGVKMVLVSPEKIVTNIIRSLNDERGIKTTVVEQFTDVPAVMDGSTAIFADATSISNYEIPDSVQNSEIIVVKHQLKELPAEFAKALDAPKRKVLNLPANSVTYQKLLDKLIKPKENRTRAIEVAETAPAKNEELPALKMLVVDDNKVNLMMMEVIMKNIGYKVDFANNGREAVDKCLANNYDLVFMDVQMPEMDGIEATTIITAELKEKSPAIVALTANAFPEDKQACIDAGMIDFLPKPVTMDTIKALLGRLFTNILLAGKEKNNLS